MSDNTSQKVRSIIAKECGVNRKFITNNTQFMSGQTISYFDCVDAMFVLQHKLHVSLPESNYKKYKTVGALIKDITKQLKSKTK